jgi:hypothetical protein
LRYENVKEIVVGSVSKLFLGGRKRAIRILEMSDGISPGLLIIGWWKKLVFLSPKADQFFL